jgi:hypothetical protein
MFNGCKFNATQFDGTFVFIVTPSGGGWSDYYTVENQNN